MNSNTVFSLPSWNQFISGLTGKLICTSFILFIGFCIMFLWNFIGYIDEMKTNPDILCGSEAYSRWMAIIPILSLFILFSLISFIVNCCLKEWTAPKGSYFFCFLCYTTISLAILIIAFMPSTTQTGMIVGGSYNPWCSSVYCGTSKFGFQLEFDGHMEHFHVFFFQINVDRLNHSMYGRNVLNFLNSFCIIVNSSDTCSTWGPIINSNLPITYKCDSNMLGSQAHEIYLLDAYSQKSILATRMCLLVAVTPVFYF